MREIRVDDNSVPKDNTQIRSKTEARLCVLRDEDNAVPKNKLCLVWRKQS